MAKKVKVKCTFAKERVITEESDAAREFYNASRYGRVLPDKTVELSLVEAFYLLNKTKITITFQKKKLTKDQFLRKAIRKESNFWTRYCVFADMRDRGYIIKTALKFGADFRVYERGVKPGEEHAKWLIYPVKESQGMTWYDFAAKNRVANTTKKRLMVGIVDDEGSVTYYEIRWMRP